MKSYPAIATLEFDDIPLGMQVVDALIKKAPISVIKCGVISPGRYLTLMAGSTASVDESFSEGVFLAGAQLVDSCFLPDIAVGLYQAIFGLKTACGDGAIGVLETDTVSSNIRAMERVLKSTIVQLLELRTADSLLNGKGLSIINGELHDVEEAMEIATAYLEAERRTARHRILTAPHEAMATLIHASTSFGDNPLTNLNGEIP